MPTKHAFVSGVADGADATLVQPGDWNAEHILTTITPATITSNEDDYNPAGFADADIVLLTSDTNFRQIRSLAARPAGTIVTLVNRNVSSIIWIMDEDGTTAANRFNFRFGVGETATTPEHLALYGRDAITIWYDGTSTRWKVYDVKAHTTFVEASPLVLPGIADTSVGVQDPWLPGGVEMWNEYAIVNWDGASTITVESLEFGVSQNYRTFWIANRSNTQFMVISETGAGSGFGFNLPGGVNVTIPPQTARGFFFEPNNSAYYVLSQGGSEHWHSAFQQHELMVDGDFKLQLARVVGTSDKRLRMEGSARAVNFGTTTSEIPNFIGVPRSPGFPVRLRGGYEARITQRYMLGTQTRVAMEGDSNLEIINVPSAANRLVLSGRG